MQFTTYTAAAIIAFTSASSVSAQNVFESAAGKLISDYIPTSVFQGLETPIMSAASAAQVTGDFSSIVGSALQASSVPEWFQKAWPTEYSSQYEALTGAVAEIRTAATSAESAAQSKATDGASGAGAAYTTVKDGVTSVVSDAESRITSVAGDVKSKATDVASDVKSKATDVASDVRSRATDVASDIRDGAASLTSEIAAAATSSENGGARQTAAYGAAALGAMGLVMAL